MFQAILPSTQVINVLNEIIQPIKFACLGQYTDNTQVGLILWTSYAYQFSLAIIKASATS